MTKIKKRRASRAYTTYVVGEVGIKLKRAVAIKLIKKRTAKEELVI